MNQKDIDVKRIIKALNQRPIAYYPVYRVLMGSVAGGVMLSQIMYCYVSTNDDQDEFEKSDSDLKRETGLSEWELKNEKYKLRSLDFIKVSVKGIPATTYYKIDHDKFIEKLAGLEHALQTGEFTKLARRPRTKQVRSASSKHSFIEEINKIKDENTAPKNGAPSLPPADPPKTEKQPTEWQILFGSLAEVCGFDIGIASNAARVGKRLKELMKANIHPTRKLLLEHYGEPNGKSGWNWYRNDWRGKDKAPTPEQVGETWGNWKIIKGKPAAAPSVGYNPPPDDLSELTMKEFGLA